MSIHLIIRHNNAVLIILALKENHENVLDIIFISNTNQVSLYDANIHTMRWSKLHYPLFRHCRKAHFCHCSPLIASFVPKQANFIEMLYSKKF